MAILLLEPFYGGSHKKLIDLLSSDLIPTGNVEVFTLPAKKWHWRARTAAIFFAQKIPNEKNFR
jgi:hypothetical protein